MPGAPFWVCQQLQNCWVFHDQQFALCIKNGAPPKGLPASGRPVVKNGSLMKEDKGGWHELCIATDRLHSQLSVQYNIGAQRHIKECITRCTLTQMGYGSRRPNRVPLLSEKNKKLRLQWAKQQTLKKLDWRPWQQPTSKFVKHTPQHYTHIYTEMLAQWAHNSKVTSYCI